MKFSKKKCSAVALALIVVMMIAGCSSSKKTAIGVAPDVSEDKYGFEYPLKTDKTLTVWTNRKPDPAYLTFEDQPIMKEMEKRTGVKAQYIFSSGDSNEAFNLLIASGEYPDIIINTWLGSAYNPANAIREGVIYPIDDIVKAYTPNFRKHLEANEEYAKYVKTDDGQLFAFSPVEEKNVAPWIGPIVRADLMEKLNIEDPKTIDDWTKMLKTFKENGVATPLTYQGNMMADSRYAPFIFGAYETAFDYYLDDNGDVKYGPMEDSFKEAVALMRSWYEEGLLDKEFVSIDDTTVGQKILDGRAAVTHYFLSRILSWKQAAEENGTNYTYKALSYPTKEATDGIPEFGHMPEAYNISGAVEFGAISTQCKDIELAAKYIDYWYSDEGSMLGSFGIEGTTYEIVNGEVELLEPFKTNFDQLNAYIKMDYVKKSNPRFSQLRYTDPAQAEARDKIWLSNMTSHILPPVIPSQEEADELNKLVANISDYANEQVLKFITGSADMGEYDAFVAELKRLGVERVIEIKTNQMERFNNR